MLSDSLPRAAASFSSLETFPSGADPRIVSPGKARYACPSTACPQTFRGHTNGTHQRKPVTATYSEFRVYPNFRVPNFGCWFIHAATGYSPSPLRHSYYRGQLGGRGGRWEYNFRIPVNSSFTIPSSSKKSPTSMNINPDPLGPPIQLIISSPSRVIFVAILAGENSSSGTNYPLFEVSFSDSELRILLSFRDDVFS